MVGNGVATLAVAKWEGQLDEERARAVLRGDLPFTPVPEADPTAVPQTAPQAGAKPEATDPETPAGTDREPVPAAG